METGKQVRIVQAAILYNGKVYRGWRHHLIGLDMLAARKCQRPYPGGKAQGFVTSEGAFVDRQEAYQIAIASGQIVVSPCKYELYSEDLWDKDGNHK